MNAIDPQQVLEYIEQLQTAQDETLASVLDDLQNGVEIPIGETEARAYYAVGAPLLTLIHQFVKSLGEGESYMDAVIKSLNVSVEESKRDGYLDPEFPGYDL
jgi:hypothetical protein